MLDVKKASKELDDKSLKDIQRDTAYTWASRAIAAFQKSKDAKGIKEKLKWAIEGEEYRHESIEHAALVEDPALLKEIMDAINAGMK